MLRRLALATVLLAVLAVGPLLRRAGTPPPPRDCAREGRGSPPRGWLGCAADAGPERALAADERLALGVPVDPNAADARSLAFVPGLSRRLGAEIVRDREARGPFASVEELLRVRGIGPKRLARARPHLAVDP